MTAKRIAKATPTTAPKTTAVRTPRRLAGAALEAKTHKAKVARVEKITNWINALAMVGVGLIAFVASYQELRDLCILAGKSHDHWYSTANLIPISVDLMLIIASIRLRRKGITKIARIIARAGSLGGLLLSLSGNVVHGWWTSVPASVSANYVMILTLVVSAVPVASLLASTEMLTHTHKDVPVTKLGKAKAAKGSEEPVSAPPTPAPAPVTPQTNGHKVFDWSDVRTLLIPARH